LAVIRSLFSALKTQRVVFTNPAAGVQLHREPPPPAFSLDPTRRVGLLEQADRPDARLIVLLAGVHALRSHQIRVLTLDQVQLAAGTLQVGAQTRRLDRLTRNELRTWLEHRRARWPASANPYLLVNQSTAGGTAPVNRAHVHEVLHRLGLTAEDLRVDRLLAEVHATDGDPLKLTRLFAITEPTAIRYCRELSPLDQPDEPHRPEFAELTTAGQPQNLQKS
jgi:hypothetical protein